MPEDMAVVELKQARHNLRRNAMKFTKSLMLLGCVLAMLPACTEQVVRPRAPAIAGLTHNDLALFRAVDNSNIKEIQQFITQGANVNAKRQPWNMTPLLFAMEKHTNIAKTLVDAGADVNASDREGSTVLMKAVQTGNLDTVKLLLANSAKTELRDRFDETALVYAVVLGRTEIIKALINAGADVNFVRYDGRTILLLAKNIVASAKKMKFSKLTRHRTGNQHHRDHGQKNDPGEKHHHQHRVKTISSARYNKNSGLTPHKRYVKSQPRHKPEVVTKKQLIIERKQITSILVAAGAKARTYKPRASKKQHH